MDLTLYAQTYRASTPGRQQELNECLRRNLNHPGIRKLVLFKESDAPPLPEATVELEVVESNTRLTYTEWLRWVQRQGSGIGLLLNADIYLDEGLEHLAATFDTPEAFLALTRYNPGHAGFHLNDYPHWTQDVWGVRADAELPESLLYASSFPLGFPGCDNRIAHNSSSVHLQASTARHDKTSDRLYGGVNYVHPSLAPDEDAELEFTVWIRSEQRPAGVLINQQAIKQGVHQLRHGEAEVAQRFLDQQQFTGLAWVHEALGSAHLKSDMHPFTSEDPAFLDLARLLPIGENMHIPKKGGQNNETASAVIREREENYLTRDSLDLAEAGSSSHHKASRLPYLNPFRRTKRMATKTTTPPKVIDARKACSLSKYHVIKILNTINSVSKARYTSTEGIKRLTTAGNMRSNA